MKHLPKRSPLTRFLHDLFGTVFLLVTVACLFSLAKFLYFPSRRAALQPKELPPDKFSQTISKPVGAGHFHILDETVRADAENATVCLQCHGNFCHVKSDKLRSFYNMHSFFLACESCHVRKTEEVSFQWFEDRTGRVLTKVTGPDGHFGAKIVPVKRLSDGKLARLDVFPDEARARHFLEHGESYTEAEKQKFVQECMKKASAGKPIQCDECHRKNGYMDYVALGYTPVRAAQLSRNAIVDMSEGYMNFYFPNIVNPDAQSNEGGDQ